MLDRIRLSRFLATCALAALGACAARAPGPGSAQQPADRAADLGPGTPYEVTVSDVAIEVYRDGPLAELGHNHVIGSTGLAGRIAVAEPLARSSFVLELPVNALTVDEPARLAAAGAEFPDRLSAEDKEATRSNMLSAALLDAGRFSHVRLESIALEVGEQDASSVIARTRVTVAGRSSEIRVPLTLGFDGPLLKASGEVALTHAQLGLTPYSALMGALRVGDALRVSWRIEARPVAGIR